LQGYSCHMLYICKKNWCGDLNDNKKIQ
jgi:hypothetical protein